MIHLIYFILLHIIKCNITKHTIRLFGKKSVSLDNRVLIQSKQIQVYQLSDNRAIGVKQSGKGQQDLPPTAVRIYAKVCVVQRLRHSCHFPKTLTISHPEYCPYPWLSTFQSCKFSETRKGQTNRNMRGIRSLSRAENGQVKHSF